MIRGGEMRDGRVDGRADVDPSRDPSREVAFVLPV
jgi:hypothetical protein